MYDYHDWVSSIRFGSLLGKIDKSGEWVREPLRRDHHLFAIEDPFDLTHDLGRQVDRDALFEIRGEFMRAQKIMSNRGTFEQLMEAHTGAWRDDRLAKSATSAHHQQSAPSVSMPRESRSVIAPQRRR